MIEPGRELEIAIWYDANKYLDPMNSCDESIKDMLDIVCAKNKVVRADIDYEILKPGDDRVPPIPRWLEIVDGVVPRLFVATAKIVSNVHQEPIGIIGDLDKKDIIKLRFITKREYHKVHPNSTPLTNHECDQIIDKLGMQIVLDQLGSSTVN